MYFLSPDRIFEEGPSCEQATLLEYGGMSTKLLKEIWVVYSGTFTACPLRHLNPLVLCNKLIL
jgi:hypothetical protein